MGGVGIHRITKHLHLFRANYASSINDKFDLMYKANDMYNQLT